MASPQALLAIKREFVEEPIPYPASFFDQIWVDPRLKNDEFELYTDEKLWEARKVEQNKFDKKI